MAEQSLGLSSQHGACVIDYLKFAKSNRTQCLSVLQSSVDNLKESRLTDSTFTAEEVSEMLDGLCVVLKADVESDLLNAAHTNALLLRQLFQQAEKWHLKLQANIAEIEDKVLLDQIAQVERTLSPGHSFVRSKGQLEPLNSQGGDKLLHLEIKRLEEENEQSKQKLRSLESMVSTTLAEKDQLKSKLSQQMVSSVVSSVDKPREVDSLKQEISRLTIALSQTKPTQEVVASPSSNSEVAKLSQELLMVNSELEQTKQELEAKFNSTSQYQNMKKMLASKNTTISSLRAKLSQYEKQ